MRCVVAGPFCVYGVCFCSLTQPFFPSGDARTLVAPVYRIGVNALFINFGVNGGTETYFDNIVRPWYENEQDDVCILLMASGFPSWWEGEKPWFKIRLFPHAKNIINRCLIEQLVYPFFLSGKIDLLFNPGYVGSLFLACPQVNTVHDAFAWVYPKEIGLLRSVYWKLFIPATARKASRIIAVSNHTADDLTKYCGTASEKIQVIYEGARQSGAPQRAGVLKDHGLEPNAYFICVGVFKEIKNPFRIIAAFHMYKAMEPSSRAKLVLSGHVGGADGSKILDYARRIKDVVCVGRIDGPGLMALYQNSLGLVFPSLYEGFGLPILEAQENGCPVVTANVASMPEVAGGGAIIVDPFDVNEIASALRRLEFEDAGPLIEAGKKNVSRFSWERASTETLDALKTATESFR